MSNKRKAKNKAHEVIGKVTEKAGVVTGDKELQEHGKAEQTRANLQQAGEKVKDAFSH